MEKKNLAVIFGGQSSEHEISCLSVVNVISHIDIEKWNVLLIGITREGHWVLAESPEAIRDGSWIYSPIEAEISPDGMKHCVIITYEDGAVEEIGLDCAFPVLHGKYGEDGSIQGLFELANIPYVGCGIMASAAGMDKFFTKIIVNAAGIRQAAYVGLRAQAAEELDGAVRAVEEKLSYPVFVKPSRAGSSCGVSKAADREALKAALKKAFEIDTKVLVEEFIRGREIECAVLDPGNGELIVSGVGEILAAAEFYDYDSKYNNPDSRTVIDPELPDGVVDEIRRNAGIIFRELDCCGLSRVDFFVTGAGEVVFNEINTLPGFTAISMYPSLMEHKGIGKDELIAKLIDSALSAVR